MFDWWGRRSSKGCHGPGRGNRAVDTAVGRVLALAEGPDRSVSAIARVWSRSQGRLLVIEDAALPVGVFGRWLATPGRDVVQVDVGVVGRDRTIAHELGHMVLGHRGQPVVGYVAGLMQVASTDLVARMLQRSCTEADGQGAREAWPAEECAAEHFAGLLMGRIEAGHWDHSGWGYHLDDALG